MYLNRKIKHSPQKEEVGYWRKANQVHAWFVKNVQNGIDECQESKVTREQLQELLAICKKIKAESIMVSGILVNGYSYENGKKIENNQVGNIIFNPAIADELLPTQSGFFFGGADYDEYYMQDIDSTIEILTKTLEYEDDEFIYRASW
jgi:hypothetical protein